MSVEVPEMEELLRLVPTAQYGDASPGDSHENSHGGHHSESSHAPRGASQGEFRGGALHLSSLLPAVSSAIGHPIATAVHSDPRHLQAALGLPDVKSAIVVLVDGLGYWNIAMRLGHAPTLRSLMNDAANQRPISTCAPSTTVAAMATFGTGTCPGLTGMTGYTQKNPLTGQLSQLIQFKEALEPADLQRQPTVFERLRERGVRVTSSGLPKFANSPLTQAALRGSDYIGSVTPRDRVLAACKSASAPGLSYLYIRDADKVGHNYGWNSDQWIAAFERIDAQLGLLRRSAPAGTLILITADHGMVGADPAERIDIAEEPRLSQGVELVGGEPRSVMLYADRNTSADELAARWTEFLGDRALVRTKTQAIEQGVFGAVDARVLPMIGDVLVQATGAVTIVDSRSQAEKATRLPSVHGSQTRLEMDIPCLVDVV
ncbi:nucleotide pyrophosphatase [Bifidobacterium lemurum]|uniref:Nucleotide pyrophosphatase n=1 Tax=Bifidobacterium lemurum TaxID=1603886 RepID=A0A261FWL5_9BIFI|nr:alkaline phosphatase family protein [Bifidobacterium lemurum]OZG63375.1 nucleotide pyrophosphatase [Bifidobacterium lemurum]QOL34283.1 alkaline phosphatase family protein [Bifidobacterium lemurum]